MEMSHGNILGMVLRPTEKMQQRLLLLKPMFAVCVCGREP